MLGRCPSVRDFRVPRDDFHERKAAQLTFVMRVLAGNGVQS